MDLDDGPREQLTDDGGRRVRVAGDGRVHFSRGSEGILFELDPATRDFATIMGEQVGLGGSGWQVTENAVFFINETSDTPGQAWLFRYDRSSGDSLTRV